MIFQLKSIEKIIESVLGAIAIITSVMVVGLMVFLVIARYLLGLSIVGLHELILLFTLQLYMVGALIAAQRKTQVTVDWLTQRFAGRGAGDWHSAVVAALTLIATVFFIVWVVWMLSWGIERPQTTPTLGLPLWISQASIVFCAFGCAGFALRDLVQAITKLRGRS
ncbi:MAG: TRAP transporter small permease [Proteobacteria bacterium]|nr:TRAP transporter small permease [Pseudomonadota bacterium]